MFTVVSTFASIQAHPASAQGAQYPPPTVTPQASGTPRPGPKTTTAPAACLVVTGEVDGRSVSGSVDHQGEVTLEGGPGCAEPFGQVDAYADCGLRVALGTMTALEDGSYSGTFTLPASVQPGQRCINADIEGRGELSRDIEVLGVTQAASDVGSGELPVTGIGIFALVALAMALICVGVMLALRVRNEPRALGIEVQSLDTSRFEPTSRRDDRH